MSHTGHESKEFVVHQPPNSVGSERLSGISDFDLSPSKEVIKDVCGFKVEPPSVNYSKDHTGSKGLSINMVEKTPLVQYPPWNNQSTA